MELPLLDGCPICAGLAWEPDVRRATHEPRGPFRGQVLPDIPPRRAHLRRDGSRRPVCYGRADDGGRHATSVFAIPDRGESISHYYRFTHVHT